MHNGKRPSKQHSEQKPRKRKAKTEHPMVTPARPSGRQTLPCPDESSNVKINRDLPSGVSPLAIPLRASDTRLVTVRTSAGTPARRR